MNRKFKMLGLAFVAVLAMSAVAASGAQALEFTAEKYPVTVSGAQTAGKTHVFTYQGRQVTCASALFDPIEPYGGPSKQLEVTPTYTNCHAIVLGNKLPVTVTHNECLFEFTVGAALTGNEVHVRCPAGKRIQIHVYKDANHKEEACTYEIASQTIGGIDYSNMAGDVTVKTNSTVATTKFFGDFVTCGANAANATYVSEETTVTGEQGGAPVKVDVG